jgi:5-formyltetrahydrofolate cyclo-ligase
MREHEIVIAKSALRQRARAARDAMTPDERAVAADAIAARVDDGVLATLAPGALLCLYDAMGSEVPTRAIAARALARGLALVYPRVRPGGLHLALHLATPATLRAGTWGICEPAIDAPEVNPRDVAAVLMPGLAFDLAGNRLGFGRGHYDATFAAAPDRLRVGLAFESQLVEERLPSGLHDLAVHILVTERALRDLRAP